MEIGTYEVIRRLRSDNEIDFYHVIDLEMNSPAILRVIDSKSFSNGDFDNVVDTWYELYEEYLQTVTNFKYLPRVHKIDTVGLDGAYAVLEYHEGLPLIETPTRKMTSKQIEELLEGVWHLHKKGIFHGQIVPENVWITKMGHVLLYGANEWKALSTRLNDAKSDIGQIVELIKNYGEVEPSKAARLSHTSFQSIEEILEFLQNPLKPGLVEKTDIDIPIETIHPVDVPSAHEDDDLPLPIPTSSRNRWAKKSYLMIASFILVGAVILFISIGLVDKNNQSTAVNIDEKKIAQTTVMIKNVEYTYEGEMKNDVPHGNGKAYDANGKIIFEGQFETGSFTGKGSQFTPTGNLIYEGEYLNGLRHGVGKLYSEADQSLLYEGSFESDSRSGLGKTYTNGHLEYEGQFAMDFPNGEGKFYSENNTLLYEGHVENGVSTGQGTVYTPDGKLFYKGEVMKDFVRHGNGVTYQTDGSILHKGEYSNGLYYGEGELYQDGILHYSGQFTDGKMNGHGKLYFSNGQLQYDGEFVNDRYEGNGKLFDNNGQLVFDGPFSNGEYTEETISETTNVASEHPVSNSTSTATQTSKPIANDTRIVDIAEINDYSGVQTLLEQGSNPNSTGYNGNTALMMAAINRNSEMMSLLLQYGANPNLQNLDGRTAIMFSSVWGDAYGVQLLLDYGANPNLKDDDGHTALQEAIEQDRTEVIAILRAVNADQGNPRN